MVRARLLVTGRVQGVWYRATTQRRAGKLGIVGWVRNLPDGRVELELQGAREAVDQLIAWCRVGPDYAEVSDVVLEWIEPCDGERAFWIRR